jgi:hypothetical protein
MRRCALVTLRAGRRAAWHPFDFTAGEQTDGSYRMAAAAPADPYLRSALPSQRRPLAG